MGIIAIIPARAGSKRIPGKNLKLLNGIPLIAWTLKTAVKAGIFDRVIVSTEDKTIAQVARQWEGEVPWLRSPHLATDSADVTDALGEVLDNLARDKSTLPDAVMLLQPTSPFRKAEALREAVRIFRASGESVVSVRPAYPPLSWYRMMDEQGMLRPIPQLEAMASASPGQSRPCVLNGSVYLASVDTLRRRRSLYSENTRGLLMESEIENLDIDTPHDWLLAEAYLPQVLSGTWG